MKTPWPERKREQFEDKYGERIMENFKDYEF
jgi:hypothetical protein